MLTTTVEYSDKPNVVAVYRNNKGQYGWTADIPAPTTNAEFGKSIAISDDGTKIAISSPFDDSIKNDQGRIYLYEYKQSTNSWDLLQTLESPNNELAEQFGYKIQI